MSIFSEIFPIRCSLFQMPTKIILIPILLLFLSGCGVNILIPNMELLEKAIALQIELEQQQLKQQLFVQNNLQPQLQINRVKVTEIESLEIQGLPSYKVEGTYNITIKLPDRKLKQQNQFQIYLQSQKQRKTWRLARQRPNYNLTGVKWLTYLIR